MSVKSQFLEKLQIRQSAPGSSVSKSQTDIAEFRLRMAQLTKQGHVYVILNIGSFGENVFKIGMTRRLQPM